MKVFIGGSRAIAKLNAAIRERLDDLIKRGCSILIGDANGADKAVQQYLAESHYANVVVFCMKECRNNVGHWRTRHIEPPGTRKDFAYYAAKDLAMSQEAQCGVMLWDARSKGTLQNIMNLVRAGKRTLVYFGPRKNFHVLASEEDLDNLLACCDVDRAAREFSVKAPRGRSSLPLPSQ